MAGISRSSTIVLAYLMNVEKKGLNECVDYLLKCRSCICPNKGFLSQLQDYEEKLGLVSKIPKPKFDFEDYL